MGCLKLTYYTGKQQLKVVHKSENAGKNHVQSFWSTDPLAHEMPDMSPYAAFNNNPIYFVDPDGMQGVPAGGGARPTRAPQRVNFRSYNSQQVINRTTIQYTSTAGRIHTIKQQRPMDYTYGFNAEAGVNLYTSEGSTAYIARALWASWDQAKNIETFYKEARTNKWNYIAQYAEAYSIGHEITVSKTTHSGGSSSSRVIYGLPNTSAPKEGYTTFVNDYSVTVNFSDEKLQALYVAEIQAWDAGLQKEIAKLKTPEQLLQFGAVTTMADGLKSWSQQVDLVTNKYRMDNGPRADEQILNYAKSNSNSSNTNNTSSTKQTEIIYQGGQ